MNNVSDFDTTADGNAAVHLWEPHRTLRQLDSLEERLSRGFLRCQPEKWFPGFPSQWIPVMLSLGCEARITEIRPVAFGPRKCETSFIGVIDGEEILVGVDDDTAKGVVEEFVPSAPSSAQRIVLSYLARRLLVSLAHAWSGPQPRDVEFKSESEASEFRAEGAVKVSFTINTTAGTVWIGLGHKWVSTLDGLWRRQVQSSSRAASVGNLLHIEIAQLGVPPQMLSDYLKPGTVIDLEVKATDSVTLRAGTKPWMPARLVTVAGAFGCEISPGALASAPVAEGTTRLSVAIGSVEVTQSESAELSQNGAVLLTRIPVGERVSLMINDEIVGSARLCVYEGRFAIEVQDQ